MAVINPLYESSPLLGLQMSESRIFLSAKDKLFFSVQQILEKKLVLHPPQMKYCGVYITYLDI